MKVNQYVFFIMCILTMFSSFSMEKGIRTKTMFDKLFRQAAKGAFDRRRFQQYFAAGGKVDSTQKDGLQLMHLAAMHGNKSIMELLFSQGAAIDAQDDSGVQPMHYAVVYGKKSVVRWLLAHGANVGASDHNGKQPIHYLYEAPVRGAPFNIRKAMLNVLLAAGGDINAADCTENRLIHSAVKAGDVDIVRLLIEKDVDLNVANIDGALPIHIVVAQAHPELLTLLLDHGADIHAVDRDGKQPVHYLCEAPIQQAPFEVRKAMLNVLLEAGGDINAVDFAEDSLIHSAVKAGDVDIVRLLIEKDVDLNVANIDGALPIHIVAQQGHLELLTLFLDCGADIHAVDRDGKKPTHYFFRRFFDFDEEERGELLPFLSLLIEKGADITAPVCNGKTILQFALEKLDGDLLYLLLGRGVGLPNIDKVGRRVNELPDEPSGIEMVQFFLESGGDVNVDLGEGRKLVHVAAGQADVALLTLLIEHDADVCAVDHEGDQPIHYFIYNHLRRDENSSRQFLDAEVDVIGILRLLLDNGVDVNVPSSEGKQLIHYALDGARWIGYDRYRGCTICDEVIQLLLEYGADINATDLHDERPIHYALRSSDYSIISLLLENNVDLDVSDCVGIQPIHYVVSDDALSKKFLQIMLDRGVDVNAADKKGRRPIHCVSTFLSSSDALALLLNSDANVNASDNKRRLAIHYVAKGSKVQVSGASMKMNILKMLLDAGINVNVSDYHGKTPLDYALAREDTDILRLLIAAGADTEACRRSDDITEHQRLLLAALEGRVDELNELIERGLNIGECSGFQHGQELIHVAAAEGHSQFIEPLLKQGADIDAVDSKGKKAIHLAVENTHWETVCALVEHGADVNEPVFDRFDSHKEGQRPIHLAAEQGNLDMVNLLFELDANLSRIDENGLEPIHLASRKGHKEVVQSLIEKGVDPNVRARLGPKKELRGKKPIHSAVQGGHQDVLALLIKYGADIHAQKSNNKWDEDYQRQAIHMAAEIGDVDILRLLVEGGADVDALDAEENSPAHCASAYGKLRALRYLMDRGANLVMYNRKGLQPIHLAARCGYIDILKLLVENKVNVCTATNNNSGDYFASEAGWQPMHYAASESHRDVLNWLLENNADLHAPDAKGAQPIHYAVSTGSVKALYWLLEHGADVSAEDYAGTTPITYAVDADFTRGYPRSSRRLRTLFALLSNGASMSSQSSLSAFFKTPDFDGGLPFVEWTYYTGDSTEEGPSREEETLTVSDLFRVAAGQSNEKLVRYIYQEYGDELDRNDYVFALLCAGVAGHAKMVKYLNEVVTDEIDDEDDLLEIYEHVLAVTAAQLRRDAFLYLLIERGAPIGESNDVLRSLLPTVLSEVEVEADLRLRTYRRYLNACSLRSVLDRLSISSISSETSVSDDGTDDRGKEHELGEVGIVVPTYFSYLPQEVISLLFLTLVKSGRLQ